MLFIAEELEPGAGGLLRRDDSHHAGKVLRLPAGSPIEVTRGDGFIYRARLMASLRKNVPFEITGIARECSPNGLHLAMAPTKMNQRFETFLEKATELGVEKITPLICRRSERKAYKRERGIKVIEAACKQSKKGYFPVLEEAQTLSEFLAKASTPPCYMARVAGPHDAELSQLPAHSTATFLIGPEGDFHPEEWEAARQQAVLSLRLGSEVLRTETAGIALAAWWAFGRKF